MALFTAGPRGPSAAESAHHVATQPHRTARAEPQRLAGATQRAKRPAESRRPRPQECREAHPASRVLPNISSPLRVY